MTNPYIATTLPSERQHDMIRAAHRGRLIALAKCCKPSNLAKAMRALHARLARRTTDGRIVQACCV